MKQGLAKARPCLQKHYTEAESCQQRRHMKIVPFDMKLRVVLYDIEKAKNNADCLRCNSGNSSALYAEM